MDIKLEDCEIERRPGWNRLRHLPSNRCVACRDGRVTDQELFSALCRDLKALEEEGLDSKDTIRIFEEARIH